MWIFNRTRFYQRHATLIYFDFVSAKVLIDLFNVGTTSAHTILRINFLHEQALLKTVELEYVNPDFLVVDILTKLLSVPKHQQFTNFYLTGPNGVFTNYGTY
jgi:hypothetical protein